jgi:hypothetical protein
MPCQLNHPSDCLHYSGFTKLKKKKGLMGGVLSFSPILALVAFVRAFYTQFHKGTRREDRGVVSDSIGGDVGVVLAVLSSTESKAIATEGNR